MRWRSSPAGTDGSGKPSTPPLRSTITTRTRAGRPMSGPSHWRTSDCARWTYRNGWHQLSSGCGKPFEYYRDLSRQLWDETRHAMMGEVALYRCGVPFYAYPVDMVASFTLNLQFTPLEAHLLLWYIEQGLMPRKTGKRFEWEVAGLYGEPSSLRCRTTIGPTRFCMLRSDAGGWRTTSRARAGGGRRAPSSTSAGRKRWRTGMRALNRSLGGPNLSPGPAPTPVLRSRYPRVEITGCSGAPASAEYASG